jgi:hypothetical protein
MIAVVCEFAGNLWITALLGLVVLGALPVRNADDRRRR